MFTGAEDVGSVGATTEPTEADYLQSSPFSFYATVAALTEEMK